MPHGRWNASSVPRGVTIANAHCVCNHGLGRGPPGTAKIARWSDDCVRHFVRRPPLVVPGGGSAQASSRRASRVIHARRSATRRPERSRWSASKPWPPCAAAPAGRTAQNSPTPNTTPAPPRRTELRVRLMPARRAMASRRAQPRLRRQAQERAQPRFRRASLRGQPRSRRARPRFRRASQENTQPRL